MRDGFKQSWVSHVTYKRYHFAAVAQYRKSVEDSANNRYGDELGRLYAAQKYVQAGLSTSKRGVSPAVIVDIKVSTSIHTITGIYGTVDFDIRLFSFSVTASHIAQSNRRGRAE